MRYCTDCGSPVGDAVYCTVCGAPAGEDRHPSPLLQPGPSQSFAPETPPEPPAPQAPYNPFAEEPAAKRRTATQGGAAASFSDPAFTGPAPSSAPAAEAAPPSQPPQQPSSEADFTVPAEWKPSRRPRSLGTRSLLVSAIVAAACLVGACTGGAAVLGWWAANSLVVANQPNGGPDVIPVAMPDYEPGGIANMPDVRGLTEAQATQTLVDAGIPIDIVSITDRPAAGTPGRVIEQTPVFGVENPTAVQIVLASRAEIPEFDGRPATDVLTDLQVLGARVEQVKQFRPGATVGAAIGISPKPGSEVPESVTLYVADTPGSMPLEELDTFGNSYGCSTGGELFLGNTAFDTSLECASDSDTSTYEWLVAGKVDQLTGQIGIDDTDTSAGTVRVRVLADGSEVAAFTVGRGPAQKLAIPLTGTQRLTLALTSLTDDEPYVSLVDAELLGSVGAITELKAR
jgi:NPCBM/NEW2 domain/PASTA domain